MQVLILFQNPFLMLKDLCYLNSSWRSKNISIMVMNESLATQYLPRSAAILFLIGVGHTKEK